MNITTKPVVSIARDAAVLVEFSNLTVVVDGEIKAGRARSSQIQSLALVLSNQVKSLDLPLSSKLGLIKVTYADEFAEMGKTAGLDKEAAKVKSNTVAALNAAIVCYTAGAEPVVVKAAEADKPAVIKAAEDLSLSAMREHAAEIKETVKETEAAAAATAALAVMTPEQRKETEAANAKKAAEAEAASTAKTAKIIAEANTATNAEFCKNLSGILAIPECRKLLEASFLTVGLRLEKCKAAPIANDIKSQLAAIAK
jgi:hypothetical protein